MEIIEKRTYVPGNSGSPILVLPAWWVEENCGSKVGRLVLMVEDDRITIVPKR